MQLYANVRPVRTFPGTKSCLRGTEHIDWLLIRENSEGEYAGQGGRSHVGTPWEVVSTHSPTVHCVPSASCGAGGGFCALRC